MALIRRQLASLSALALISFSVPNSVAGQSIFDRIGNQFKQQVESEVRRGIASFPMPARPKLPQLGPPSQPSNPSKGYGSAYGGVPGMGGAQNNNSPFASGSFFGSSIPGTSSGPIFSRPSNGSTIIPYSSSTTTYQSNSYRPNAYTQYSQPINGYSSSSQPVVSSQSYSEPTSKKYREPSAVSGQFSGETIKIRCPKSSAQAVTYKLVLGSKSFAYTMQPGESQSFQEDKLWLIRYISGSEEVTFRLRGGNVYSFDIADGRIILFRDTENFQEFPEPPTRDES